ELEPGQEVERLSEVAPVVQPPRDRREVFKPGGDVMRAFLEDPPPFVLRQIPPRLGFPDRDQRCPGCPRAAQRLLARNQLAVLGGGAVHVVAGAPAEPPDRICRARGAGALDDLKARSRGQRTARDRFQALNAPPAGTGAHKHDTQRWHRTTVLPSPHPAIRPPGSWLPVGLVGGAGGGATGAPALVAPV